MKNKEHLLILLFSALVSFRASTQNCSSLNIQLQADIPSTCNFITMTMIHDNLNRPYLYVANKEGGLTIYDITTLTAPNLVATVATSLVGSRDVMNVSQYGNYLYLAIGNSFTNPQQGGMAIVDVTNPTAPVVTDYYLVPAGNSGAGIVKVEGNYAYLGAMKSGLVILDVSNVNNIQFVSQFMPDINWPVNNPNANYYNARGMEVKNDIVYLCFDAGGLRIINCVNKLTPVQTGRYANPATYVPFNLPRAYNNIVLDDSLAYITVDYCGLEVLDISDTSNISLYGWWNPYNCPNNNWFTSPSHANEIMYNQNCKQLFISSGKSDMMVIDVSNPALPDSCNFYGGVNNNIGTWGAGLYQNQIYLAYICTLGTPFPSNYTGVKILTYTPCSTGMDDENNSSAFAVYPNPAKDELQIDIVIDKANAELFIYNSLGEEVMKLSAISSKQVSVNVSELPAGLYFISQKNDFQESSCKFIVEK